MIEVVRVLLVGVLESSSSNSASGGAGISSRRKGSRDCTMSKSTRIGQELVVFIMVVMIAVVQVVVLVVM